jgi:myo-inositol 2-dehydrogenase/D-chiro-inositol 1-dehydrogenase
MLRAENMLENTVELSNASGFTTAPTQPFFLERYGAAYRAEMEHFVDVINGGGVMTPTGIDGLKAQLLADAADAAARDGQPRHLGDLFTS